MNVDNLFDLNGHHVHSITVVVGNDDYTFKKAMKISLDTNGDFHFSTLDPNKVNGCGIRLKRELGVVFEIQPEGNAPDSVNENFNLTVGSHKGSMIVFSEREE